jgi:hypothetical protein
MTRPTMTYDLAMAAAKDAAERQRRADGRTTWSAEDYQLSVDTFVRLFPLEYDKAQGVAR